MDQKTTSKSDDLMTMEWLASFTKYTRRTRDAGSGMQENLKRSNLKGVWVSHLLRDTVNLNKTLYNGIVDTRET